MAVSLKPVNMLHYLVKGPDIGNSGYEPSDREVIPDNLGRPNLNTGAFKGRGRWQKGESERCEV